LGFFIIILQVIILSDILSTDDKIPENNLELLAFQRQIDSIRLIEIENNKLKIFPFNPNYITDFKGEQLGMSLEEIDKLFDYRKTGKFINSKQEFQKITKVSDSLLAKISPYFKFPDWVEKRNQQEKGNSTLKNYTTYDYVKISKKELSTFDLNKATAKDLEFINGIGEKTAERIIQYRSKLQGFTYQDQLYEVWGLKKEIADKVFEFFKINEKPIIKKENVNILTFKQLLKIPYVDYELCKKIFNYKDEVAEIQDISELKKIKDFPTEIYNRLVLYLQAE